MLRLLCSLLLCAFSPVPSLGANWYPVPVVADGKPLSYAPLAAVTRPWRICALLPHGQDRFWWGVSWGLAEEAKRLNIKLGVYEAGGYEHLEVQRRQFAHCVAQRADAIVLSAIVPNGLTHEIADAIGKGAVVIDLINGSGAANVTARAVGDTSTLSVMAARYLLAHATKQPVSLVWFPGPKNAEWVAGAEKGMRSVLKPGTAMIIDGGYDVPESTRQMSLIRAVFQKFTPDYVLGNAVAAVAAARFVGANPAIHTKVIAWYANEPVVQLIREGKIEAAPSNHPVLQARIGLDLALRALERQPHPFDVKVVPEMIDARTVHLFQTEKLYAPAGTWMVQRPLPP